MSRILLMTRHGAATQERRTPEELASVQALPDEEFQREILAMNMRQGLTERGRLQAADLGRRIGQVLLPDAVSITALVGPYKRHQESAEVALSVPELSDRQITLIADSRLAERNRGRLDASIWPARKLKTLPPEHPYGDQSAAKERYPATWRPPHGENYADVNKRVDRAFADHGVESHPHPVVVFGSGEMSLARLGLTDDEYRQGTVTEHGEPMPLVTLNNAGIVALHGPDTTNTYTHWQIHDPVEIPKDQPHSDPYIIRSRINEF